MKTKKLFLPIIILAVAILVTAAYSALSNIARKPTVTEGQFRFAITYELDGETVTINDVYKARYVGNGGYADTKMRLYTGEIGNMGENNTIYTLKTEGNTRIELWTHFYADYLMGDPEYDYFDEEAFAPRIYYFDAQEQEYSDEETLQEQGVKLISFEYPEPIDNTFTFSHISHLSSANVLPMVLIGLLALAATIIFVKKEKQLQRKPVDLVSLILNYVIGFAVVPFVILVAVLIDINGGGPELYRQVLYFLPVAMVLCITASIALRRKGYGVSSLIAQLVGPAAFAVYLVACGAMGLL